MAQFELIGNDHRDVDGTVFERGEVIESDKDLDVMFREKFRRVGGKNKRPRDLDESLNQSGETMDPPAHVMKALKKKAAKAAKPKPTAYIVTNPSDRHWQDDEGKDAQKGRKSTDPLQRADMRDTQRGKAMDETIDDEEPDGDQGDLGRDVSKHFPDARHADLKVYKDGEGQFHVADADEPEKALNENPLASKKEVNRFFKNYRAGKTKATADDDAGSADDNEDIDYVKDDEEDPIRKKPKARKK